MQTAPSPPVSPPDGPAGARLAGRIDRLQRRVTDLTKAMPLAERLGAGAQQALLSAVGAVVAYLPTQALGLREGFWGAITAIAVMQTEFGAARNTGRDQVIGSAIGGAIAVAVVLTLGQGLGFYILAVVLSVLACAALNVGSASRLAAITATIIILVPHSGSPQHMLLSRVGEVAWGALVGLGLVWLFQRLREAQSEKKSGMAGGGGAGPRIAR
ncbi:FUSC family protein [Roseomonas nepalensis]|uniref:FUSC family protein n=1 Tax=Muricoccus nepalensis TaxID=1854500 RepID=A0A502G1P8_9PROT|nr:FUSC family protein [Roseomonas nepalensis]TPG55695.1 FUSC family protein [Roseomonas nepalensis]